MTRHFVTENQSRKHLPPYIPLLHEATHFFWAQASCPCFSDIERRYCCTTETGDADSFYRK